MWTVKNQGKHSTKCTSKFQANVKIRIKRYRHRGKLHRVNFTILFL